MVRNGVMSVKIKYLSRILALGLLAAGCGQSFTPKPRGYFRIDLPQKEYHRLEGDYPYSFEIPDYSKVNPYKGQWKDTDTSGYWINIEFPAFKSRIHLTYKMVNDNLAPLINDAHTFAYKHSILADAIAQSEYVDTLSDVYGILFDIKGNTASSVQFYVTDSVRHFLRGALYFDTEPNKDSLAPVIQYLRIDIERIIESLTWVKI